MKYPATESPLAAKRPSNRQTLHVAAAFLASALGCHDAGESAATTNRWNETPAERFEQRQPQHVEDEASVLEPERPLGDVIEQDAGAASPEAVYEVYGRVDRDNPGEVRFDWPGVYFEARFSGRSVVALLDGPTGAYFDVYVDGSKRVAPDQVATAATLQLTEGVSRYLLADGLPPGDHTVRLVRRNETAPVTFRGFVFPVGFALAPPARPNKSFEFIGDSFTAGYGNLSPSRNAIDEEDQTGFYCSDDELMAYSSAEHAYGAVAAKLLNAEWRILATSGTGMVRNYRGERPEETIATEYDRALSSDALTMGQTDDWEPDAIVLSIGRNDFSTPLEQNDEGRFQDRADLRHQFKEGYRKFLSHLRELYGEVPIINAVSAWPGEEYRSAVREVHDEETASAPEGSLYYFDMQEQSLFGCFSHLDIESNRQIGARLAQVLQPLLRDATSPQ